MHFCDVYILKGSKNTAGSNSICPQLPQLGLTVVDQQVSLQRKWGAEQSFAFVTLKWPFLRVSLLVVLVNISVSKSLSTKLALIGFIFAVDYFVGAHLIKPLEWFVTDLTVIRSLFCEKWVETISHWYESQGPRGRKHAFLQLFLMHKQTKA